MARCWMVAMLLVGPTLAWADADGDGYSPARDCDDMDPTVHPGAPEACNGVDDDCDGAIDEGCDVDRDGDGYSALDDCDDGDPLTNPGAYDDCGDGIDRDCDGWDPACDAPLIGPPEPGVAGARNELYFTGAAPGATVFLIAGDWAPRGPEVPGCPGLATEMSWIKVLDRVEADGRGDGVFDFFLPEGARDRAASFQAVDKASCVISDAMIFAPG